MDFDLKGFGEKIKDIRLENGLRQTDVSDIVGINRDTLRKLENGLVLPKIDTLEQLSYVYKRDIYKLFSEYRINIDNYISNKMKTMVNHFYKYNYDQIIKETELFYEAFKNSSYYSNQFLNKKMNQFKTYLFCLADIKSSFDDEGRDAITQLFTSLEYSHHDLKNHLVRLDKLEMRIIMLLSTIYRYRDEFISTLDLLEAVHFEIINFHRNDKEFLRFYILTLVNLMTYYHRIDEHEKIEELYKESLTIIDDEITLNNFAYYFIRTGLSKAYLKDLYGDDLINVGLSILRDGGYENKYDKHLETFIEKYPFLSLKKMQNENDIE